MTNPLLETWTTPFGLPPFDRISDDHLARRSRLPWARRARRLRRLPHRCGAAGFANTIEALEQADTRLNAVLGAFFSVAGADSNPAREALQRNSRPSSRAFGSEVSSNKALFARIEALWEQRADAGSDGRAGAGADADAARFRALGARC